MILGDPSRRLRLPRSLRRQFVIILSLLALLVVAGGLTAIEALHESAVLTGELADEQLIRMQRASNTERQALLVERESRRMLEAVGPDEVRRRHGEMRRHLDMLDGLVQVLGASDGDAGVLNLLHAGQQLRNTAHIVAQLKIDGQSQTITRFGDELQRQVGALVEASQDQSRYFAGNYRQAMRGLVATARNNQIIVITWLAASLILAWLVGRLFLGGHVLDRLQHVSRYLLLAEHEVDSVRVPVTGEDEIADMARAVERFLVARRQLADTHAELLSEKTRHEELIGQLATANRNLEEARACLEIKVAERTADLRAELAERERAERELARANRSLRMLSASNQTLIHATDEADLLSAVCRIAVEIGGYRGAWVGLPCGDGDVSPRLTASAGELPADLEARLAVVAGDGSDNPVAEAMRSGRPALQHAHPPVIALPLMLQGVATGILVIYSDEATRFDSDEIAILDELSGDLAFGIDALRIRAEHERAEEEIRLAATAFESQEAMLIADADERVLRINKAFTAITGYGSNEIVGSAMREIKPWRHHISFYQEMWSAVHDAGAWHGEIWSQRGDTGRSFPCWLAVTAVRDRTGNVTHYVASLLDISERKQAEEEIRDLAFYDQLTRLPNRRLLLDRLRQAAASSSRTEQNCALLFIDLDDFKTINDTAGHDMGDQLLRQVGQRLLACVRVGDTVARFGGDEFLVMVEDLGESAEDAATRIEAVGEKILAAIGRTYLLDGQEHRSTASIGITLFRGGEDGIEDLLRQADIAMYQAKSAGRNTLRFFNPTMQAVLSARARLVDDLRLGLEDREFMLHYQVQVDHTGQSIGAEALLRWQHPQRGRISPAEFIPLAEETGLILLLGEWVLEMACEQLALWAGNASTRHLTLAVNVSARQFRQPEFVDQVRAVLARHAAPAEKLKIEITESLLLEDLEDIVAKMLALKVHRVSFSLDDFGTGYSSLAYLKRLPLDQLKIDQSFVRDILTDANDATIAKTIVVLSGSLGFDVIAEGVESVEQREMLTRMGCRAYQGYLFGQPVPVDEFLQHHIAGEALPLYA